MKKRHIIILSLCLLAFWGKPQLAAAQFFSAKVNALAALTATVNVGVDAAVADKWTLDVSAYWNPINSDSFSCRLYAAQIGHETLALRSVRGPFHRRPANLWKLPVRAVPDATTKGGMAGLGFSYGYAWLLSKRWNVTAEIGIGVFYMKDTAATASRPNTNPSSYTTTSGGL